MSAILLHRKIVSSSVMRDSNALCVFIYLLVTAPDQESNKVLFRNQLIDLIPGQLVLARRKIAEGLGMPESTVKNALKRLHHKHKILDIEGDKEGSLLTIINWSSYQKIKALEGVKDPWVSPTTETHKLTYAKAIRGNGSMASANCHETHGSDPHMRPTVLPPTTTRPTHVETKPKALEKQLFRLAENPLETHKQALLGEVKVPLALSPFPPHTPPNPLTHSLQKLGSGFSNKHTNTLSNILNYWNSKALPKVLCFSASRQAKVRERLKEELFEKDWAAAIDKILDSKFCMGRMPDKSWRGGGRRGSPAGRNHTPLVCWGVV